MSKQQFNQRDKRDMSWLPGLLIVVACGVGLYLWRRHKSEFDQKKLIRGDERHADLWVALETAKVSYEKKQLPYAIRQEVLSGNYPDVILSNLEATYGKSEGRPYLSLPREWRSGFAEGVRAWMVKNDFPYDESLPALHQLELLLEKRVRQEAKAILEQTVK